MLYGSRQASLHSRLAAETEATHGEGGDGSYGRMMSRKYISRNTAGIEFDEAVGRD
jgi:hypothetical protein